MVTGYHFRAISVLFFSRKSSFQVYLIFRKQMYIYICPYVHMVRACVYLPVYVRYVRMHVCTCTNRSLSFHVSFNLFLIENRVLDLTIFFLWQLNFVKSYLRTVGKEGASEEERIMMEIKVFSLASHLFWGLWSIVNAKLSEIPFGYWVSCKNFDADRTIWISLDRTEY